jgi:outer membrane protein assembly factor BamB
MSNDEGSPKLEARKGEDGSGLKGSARGPVREVSGQEMKADKAARSAGTKSALLIALLASVVALAVFGVWFAFNSKTLSLRVPGSDRPGESGAGDVNPALKGKVIRGSGEAANLPGGWTQFRGNDRDGINKETVKLLHRWEAAEPRQIWGIDVGEGYAGAAVRDGRVYLMDYDQANKQDALRCLSLADGKEIWRFAYPVSVKRNHGMSRTVPATTEKYVVAMGPKCHVVCVDSVSGELRWSLDLVREFGATVPPWYAGQCPLVERNSVILAPGGKEALVMAVDIETGKPLWRSPNPHQWKMTHSSVMPMDLGGERMYIYCADNGVAAVSARDGSILWDNSDWKISIATVPSPLALPDGRVFLSGGYDAGSLMLRIKKTEKGFLAETMFRLPANVFGATQHTPIFYQDHIYGVRADGKFVCLDLNGKVIWTSDAGQQFGLGSFVIADGLIYAMNDGGLLRLIEAKPDKYTLLAQAQALKGRESWGPLALAGGRLIARDFTRMVCLEVGEHSALP